jgi:hypothetical protein
MTDKYDSKNSLSGRINKNTVLQKTCIPTVTEKLFIKAKNFCVDTKQLKCPSTGE